MDLSTRAGRALAAVIATFTLAAGFALSAVEEASARPAPASSYSQDAGAGR